MSVSINVLGVNGVRTFLKIKNKEILLNANKAIIKAGFFVEGEVKQSIAGHRAEPKSVDTGRYLNSVKNVQNEPLTSTIESNVEYATVLEYGTSKRVARRHFTNTAKRSEAKVKNFLDKELK